MFVHPYCKYDETSESLICTNFESYSQLDFSSFSSQSVQILSLIPNGPLILGNDLDLDNLNLKLNYEVVLLNVSKIDFLSNPFAVFNASLTNRITIADSVFELAYENNTINSTVCSDLAQNEIFISLVETSSSLILDNTLFSAYPYCQFFFNQANLEYFKVMNMNSTNKLQFFDSNLVNLRDDFISTVSEFVIEESDFNLSSNLLDKFVFKNIYIFRILKSFLRDVQNDLFKSFSYLRIIEIQAYNFMEFVQFTLNNNSNNTSWLSYLNINISVDLTNQLDFNNNKEYKMQLYLTDLNETYLYPEEDFCLFKDFPHSKLVVPKINTKPNLECTCTLLYLLKYKSLYQEGTLNDLDTPSVNKCLNDPNFDQLVMNCDFNNKIKFVCNREAVTSTSSSTSSTSKTTSREFSINTTTKESVSSFMV